MKQNFSRKREKLSEVNYYKILCQGLSWEFETAGANHYKILKF